MQSESEAKRVEALPLAPMAVRMDVLARTVARLEGSVDQIRLALGSRSGSRLSDLEAAVRRLEDEVRKLKGEGVSP